MKQEDRMVKKELNPVYLHQHSIISKTDSILETDLTSQVDRIDLAYFYSQPLVKKAIEINTKVKLGQQISSHLDTHNEYLKLMQTLKSMKKEFRIVKDAINFESFKQTLTRSPKMIHISCHGDFDPVLNEFYLQFEELGTGVVDKFNQSRLNDLMGGNSTETDPSN